MNTAPDETPTKYRVEFTDVAEQELSALPIADGEYQPQRRQLAGLIARRVILQIQVEALLCSEIRLIGKEQSIRRGDRGARARRRGRIEQRKRRDDGGAYQKIRFDKTRCILHRFRGV